MKLYSKFKQLTILQLMAVLASVGIIMTFVFQYYTSCKLHATPSAQATKLHEQTKKAYIERKGNYPVSSRTKAA